MTPEPYRGALPGLQRARCRMAGLVPAVGSISYYRTHLVGADAYIGPHTAPPNIAPLACTENYRTGRYNPPCRAGACPRRCAALPTTIGVGAGIPDGPGWGAVWARQGCRALRQCCAAPHHARCGTFQTTASAVTTLFHFSLFHLTLTKGRRPPPVMGGDGGLTADAVGIAPSADGALGRLGSSRRARRGCFARCGGRAFRWLRPAGISPVATGDRGRCPLDPCNFLKKVDKNFKF